MRILIVDHDFYGAGTLAIRAEASGYVAELAEPQAFAAQLAHFDPDVVLVRLDAGPALGRAVRDTVQRAHRRPHAVQIVGHVGDAALVSQRCARRAQVDELMLTPTSDEALVAVLEISRIRHAARRFSLA